MTNSKLLFVNRVAARIYEEGNKISIEWFVGTDGESPEVLYKMDESREFLKMSLCIQNSARALQEKINSLFFGKVQGNDINNLI